MKSKKLYAAMGLLAVTALVGCGQTKETVGSVAPTASAVASSTPTATASTTPASSAPVESPAASSQVEDAVSTSSAKLADYASSYRAVLDDVISKYNDYCLYSVYDIDGDGIKELIVTEGTCEADYLLHYYKYDAASGKAVELESDQPVGDAVLYVDDQREGIVAVMGKQGHELVQGIKLADGKITVEKIEEKDIGPSEEYYKTDHGILTAMVKSNILLED